MIDFCFLEKLERVPLGARSFSPCIGEGLVGDFAASGVNVLSTLLTNSSNQKINKQNLEFAKEQWERERDYNTWMWMQNNAYNRPSEQVKRLEQAGINPALAMQNISSGSGTAQSAPHASPSAPIPMQAPDFSQFGQAFHNFMQDKMAAEQINNAAKQGNLIDAEADKTRSEAAIAKANSIVAEEMAKGTLADLVETTAGKRSQREYLDRQIPHIGRKMLAESIQAEQGIDINKLTIDSMSLQNKMTELNLRYLPKQQELELANLQQAIATALSVQRLNESQAYDVAQHAVLLQYQQVGQRIDNYKAFRLGRYLVNQAKEQVKQERLNTRILGYEENQRSHYNSSFNVMPHLHSALRNLWEDALPIGKLIK